MFKIFLGAFITLVSLDVTHGIVEVQYYKAMYRDVDFHKADGQQYAIDDQMHILHPTLFKAKEYLDNPTLGLYKLVTELGKDSIESIYNERFNK
jgi:hypothetical protein